MYTEQLTGKVYWQCIHFHVLVSLDFIVEFLVEHDLTDREVYSFLTEIYTQETDRQTDRQLSAAFQFYIFSMDTLHLV